MLIIRVFLLLVSNVLLNTSILLSVERLKPGQRESPPGQAVPVRFVMDEPECADKLPQSIIVTNVHVLSSSDNWS
jgi:hypothetical protein